MCGRLVNLDTVARVLADYYHLKTDTQLAALDEALSRVPAETVGDSHKKDHVADPCKMVGDSISRQAAIDALGEEPLVWHEDDAGEVAEHNQWRRDVAAIKALPPAQPVAKDINVPAKDCISRAQAIEAIKEDKIDLTDPNVVAVFKATEDFEKVETQVMTCDRHIKILKGLPSAQPARKGKWIEMGTNKDGTHSIRCSKCGGGYKTRGHARSIATKAKYKFCPNCGAYMRGESDG